MPSVDKDVADLLVRHAVGISAGACEITEEEIGKLHEDGEESLAEVLAGLLYLHQDLRRQEALREAATAELSAAASLLAQQNEELQESRSKMAALVEALSTPLITLARGVLMAPIIGAMDDARATSMMERVLGAVVEQQAAFLILDVTGVGQIDTETGQHFARIVDAGRLLGATCIMSGVKPSVAMSMTTAGIDFSSIATVRNVEEALRLCLDKGGKARR